MIRNIKIGNRIKRKNLMILVTKSKQLMNKLRAFGSNIMIKMKHIGNKSISLIFLNGNIELNKEKWEIYKEKREEQLLSKNKSREKKNNSLKSILNKLRHAHSYRTTWKISLRRQIKIKNNSKKSNKQKTSMLKSVRIHNGRSKKV